MTPTQRTLKLMRERGWHAEVTERWIPGANIRRDLWTICDVLCLHPQTGEILAVQTTSASNLSARVKKIAECEALPLLRKCNIGVHVHGWRKPCKGRRTWAVVERDVS